MPRTPKPVDPTALEQSVSVSLPTELVARLDAAACERVVGRGFLLRYFIEQGMANLPRLPTAGVLLMPRIIQVRGDESQDEIHELITADLAKPLKPSESHLAPESTTEIPEPSTGLLEG